MMLLGEVIRAYREEHGLSMQEFADKADLTKGYISMLEKNSNPRSENGITPSIRTFEKCARAMNITVNDLLRMVDGEQHIIVNGEDIDELYFKVGALHGLSASDVKTALEFAEQMKRRD